MTNLLLIECKETLSCCEVPVATRWNLDSVIFRSKLLLVAAVPSNDEDSPLSSLLVLFLLRNLLSILNTPSELELTPEVFSVLAKLENFPSEDRGIHAALKSIIITLQSNYILIIWKMHKPIQQKCKKSFINLSN